MTKALTPKEKKNKISDNTKRHKKREYLCPQMTPKPGFFYVLKRNETTKVDRRIWLHVPSGTLWSIRSNTYQAVEIQKRVLLIYFDRPFCKLMELTVRTICAFWIMNPRQCSFENKVYLK